MVVVPAFLGESSLDAVVQVQSLQGVGLTVNADKTAAWTLDPSTVLSPRLQGLRTEQCKVLGEFSGVGVHTLADGQSVVESAKAFVTKVLELRAAGLSAKGTVAFFCSELSLRVMSLTCSGPTTKVATGPGSLARLF